MANLSVRKLDEEVFSKPRMRAAIHGVSMEEEVRQILKQAVSTPIKLGDMACNCLVNSMVSNWNYLNIHRMSH